MIYTTYFGKIKKLPENIIPIAICGKSPEWWVENNGLEYKKLAPKKKFFEEWKKNGDNNYYINHFKKEVLDKISIKEVFNDLQAKIKDNLSEPFYTNKDFHIALVCYEKPEDFCHRHLVAKWIRDNGYNCKEFDYL